MLQTAAQSRFRRPKRVFFTLLVVALTAARASAQSDRPEAPAWRLADSDCGARLTLHRRTADAARRGAEAEMLRLEAGSGTYAYLARQVPPARVIAELSPSLWIKSDRTGLQLLARVVLPRTIDSRSGVPRKTLIAGTLYSNVGQWQQLTIRNAALLLQRQQRVLRTQLGPDVDIREAYVDLLLLNGYGGEGATTIWIGDAAMTGAVAPRTTPGPSPTETPTGGSEHATPATGRTTAGPQDATVPRLHGSVLVADSRPMLVRAIQHQGEPLAWLQSLGFNTVVLHRPPTAEQLREASRTGMWLVAPPPTIASRGAITSSHARVLAWDLGSGLESTDHERIRQLAADVRRDDPLSGRPLVCNPISGLWQYSRLADVFFVRRDPLGSSFELSDYGAWLRERMRLARPGTPLWAAVQTQYPPPLAAQWSALAGQAADRVVVDPRQVRYLTYAAVAAGARGIVFTSHSRLDGPADEDRLRAANLKLINHYLRLLEPWAAGGDRLKDVESSTEGVDVSVLQSDRSRVLLVLNRAPQQQFVLAPGQRSTVSLLSGSAPSAAQVYRVQSGDLKPAPHQRVTGGLRITLDDVGMFSLVVLSQEPLVLTHFKRLLAEERSKVAQLESEILSAWTSRVERAYKQLAARENISQSAPALLADAKSNLRRERDILETRDPRSSQLYAQRAADSLAQFRRSIWQPAAASFPSPVSSPFCVTFETLPWHWRLADRMAVARWSDNVMPAGRMERLEQMLRGGWRRQSRDDSPVEKAVELSPQAAQSGERGLRLRAFVPEPQSAVAVLEAPPIWINSPAVPVRRGQVIRIHGWVQLPAPLSGSREGLVIYDSLAGPTLAERVTQASGWREFTLYRMAPRDGEMRITFALTGIGEAWIDEVTVQLATPAAAAAIASPPLREQQGAIRAGEP